MTTMGEAEEEEKEDWIGGGARSPVSSLDSGAPTRFDLVGVPLLFFLSIGRFGYDKITEYGS